MIKLFKRLFTKEKKQVENLKQKRLYDVYKKEPKGRRIVLDHGEAFLKFNDKEIARGVVAQSEILVSEDGRVSLDLKEWIFNNLSLTAEFLIYDLENEMLTNETSQYTLNNIRLNGQVVCNLDDANIEIIKKEEDKDNIKIKVISKS